VSVRLNLPGVEIGTGDLCAEPGTTLSACLVHSRYWRADMKEDGRVRIGSDGEVYVGRPALPRGATEEDARKTRRHDVAYSDVCLRCLWDEADCDFPPPTSPLSQYPVYALHQLSNIKGLAYVRSLCLL
jgi:hypothetical protein